PPAQECGGPRARKTGEHARRTPCSPKHRGFDYELNSDILFRCAERPAQSDLPCSLPHRHEHDGQDTDRPEKERDTRNRWNESVQSCGGFTFGLEHHGLVKDDDGLWNTRSRSMAAMQDFAHVALQCFELRTADRLNMKGMKIGNIQYPAHGSLQ